MALGWGSGIESYPDMGRLLILQYIKECIRETHHGRGIQPPGVIPRIFIQSKIGPVNQSHGIKQKQFFFRHFKIFILVAGFIPT
jgi:hypothetical protein